MTIRTGIGGWTYPEWRGGAFFPAGLRQADEQAYAARAVAAIEVNATFYRLQKPATFRSWRAAAPPGFVYTLKGSRFVTNRKELASAGPGLANFLAQGILELGDMLGPIVWQLAVTKRFDPGDIAAFFALLPASHEGVPLRHAIEVGHPSFACSEFIALTRASRVAVVWSDHPERTPIADRTAGFVYARLQGMRAECATGYPAEQRVKLARMGRMWSQGRAPPGLPYVDPPAASAGDGGDVFLFCINGAKERAPAAAIALAAEIEAIR